MIKLIALLLTGCGMSVLLPVCDHHEHSSSAAAIPGLRRHHVSVWRHGEQVTVGLSGQAFR